MPAQIRLGRLFGIEIGLHYSWFIIAFLITFSLAARFRFVSPEWGASVIWTCAIVTGLLFFTAIVIHELAHALVARARGLPVRSITLFALGGVSVIEEEAADPKTEFWIGIAGPIASVVLGLVCLGLAWVFGWNTDVPATTPVVAVLTWLGYINFGLAVFNMIPGFPLDGGRVLRAVFWWITGDSSRSTRIAARVGQGVALLFILYGIVRFFDGAGVGGIWLAFIGWFLLNAAGASYGQARTTDSLRGIQVGDIMARDWLTVDRRMDLQTFVEERLLRTGRRSFVVLDDHAVAGLITLNEVKDVDRSKWAELTVGDVMRPLEQVRTVSPEAPASASLETMGREDLHQLPVLSGGRLLGVISRGDILRVIQTRAELGA